MKIYIITLFAAISICTSAQNITSARKKPKEFSIHAGSGLLSLAPISGFFNGYALDYGLGYTYFFHKNWGLHIGIWQGWFHAKNLENVNVVTPNLTDHNGYLFDLYTSSDYNETHHTMFLSIPLMLQFQTKQKPTWNWRQIRARQEGLYVMGGIKAIIPQNSKYESNHTALTNFAYYPEMDNWAGTQKFAGLGVFDGKNLDNDFELRAFLMFSLEAGIKWRLNKKIVLYTGAYLDYGLNSIAKVDRTPFRNYIAVEQFTDFPLLTFPDKMNIMIAGIQLRLAFFRDTPQWVCPYQKEEKHYRVKRLGH